MSLPLKEPLNSKDSLAFVLYARMARQDENPAENELINRFCKRTGVNRHDYITAARHPEWPTILKILESKCLLVST